VARLRKYRDAPTDGDVAIADDPVPAPAAEVAAARPTDDNALMSAVAAAQRAEELQRQHAQQPQQPLTIDQYIDGVPGLSDHKRTFLRAHPQMLEPALTPVMARVYHEGLRSGLKDDTRELDEFVLDGVERELQQHRELTSAAARPTPENREAHQQTVEAVEQLQREAEAILAETAAEHQPEPPPLRRSVPFSAPVSREVPMASGERRPGQMTLSAEERQIAHNSFRHLSKASAELEYAQNKRRMIEMKADGRIQGDR
jgi:hypothetical protein